MYKVLFVCHGNICRSPMAEFLFKYYVAKNGLSDLFYVESCATSYEEIGNPVHYGTRKILDKYHIDYSKKRARRITKADYDNFDYILAMDDNNIYNLKRILGDDKLNKIHLLLEYTQEFRNIRDPWYTGNFKETEEDIINGIKGFLNYILNIEEKSY